MKGSAVFSSEAMLCLTFIRNLPEGWKAYPETGGFDILLNREADGYQIGIEAKLSLNAKVISQIVEDDSGYSACYPGPDFRAVLIPYGTRGSFGHVCHLLGITVIEMKDRTTWEAKGKWGDTAKFIPALPSLNPKHWWSSEREWIDWAPTSRVRLPDYVPDVTAGSSAPVQLTEWKVKAIKIAVLVERRGYVTRADFKYLQLSHRRFIDHAYGWLLPGEERGQYVAGLRLGDFKRQHPKNYEQIAVDFERWAPKP